MAHALIEAAEDSIMWGTDWPHPNKYEVNPNDGDIADALGEWVTDDGFGRRSWSTRPPRSTDSDGEIESRSSASG